MDGLDIEGPEGPGELGQHSLVIRVIHPEDAVLVGVEGDRSAMLGQVSAQSLGRELVLVAGGQLLAGLHGAEVGIVGADQSQHLLANGVGQGVAGASTEARETSPEGPSARYRTTRRLICCTLRPSWRAASRCRNCLLTTC